MSASEEHDKPEGKPRKPSLHGRIRFYVVAVLAALPVAFELFFLITRPGSPPIGGWFTFAIAGFFGGAVAVVMYIFRSDDHVLLDTIAVGTSCLCLAVLRLQWQIVFFFA